MKEKIVDRVQELFAKGKIKGFVALKKNNGHIGPHVFTSAEELADLSLGDWKKPGDARYPTVSILADLIRDNPGDTYALMVRGCEERALEQLIKESRVTPLKADQVITVGFACPQELAQYCQCAKPWPDALVAGEPVPGLSPEEDQDTDLLEQLDFWVDTFNRCIKCFGCRNVCPVCACKECTIEREILVPQRQLPPSPTFLMTRAVHMVDRCVYCGLCEEACPADIPLKDLYRFVAKAMGQNGFLPGLQQVPPLPAA